MTTAANVARKDLFAHRTDAVLRQLKQTGQLKVLQTIEGPMDATVRSARVGGSHVEGRLEAARLGQGQGLGCTGVRRLT